MTTTALDVLTRVVTVLQDADSTRWDAPELVMWLNEGQYAIQRLRPDATETLASVQMAPGARQNLEVLPVPKPAFKLMRVARNTAVEGRFRSVRLVSREIMDAVLPNWQSTKPATDAVNYMVDPNLPKLFWVYPPAPVGDTFVPAMVLEIYYSAAIQPVNKPDPGKIWSEVTGDLSVHDEFSQPLVDYVIYRAFLKDAEYGGSGERAKTHFDLFQNSLMAESQGTLAATPKAKQPTT